MLLLFMPSLPIIYASASGNVLAVCEQVSEVLRSHQIANQLHRVETTPFGVWQESPVAILATSTWEHGALNPYFKKFYTELTRTNCTGKKAAFIGLGDTRYEPVLFCKGMETLRDTFVKQGGAELVPPIRINGLPYPFLETTVVEWTDRFVAALKNEPKSITDAS